MVIVDQWHIPIFITLVCECKNYRNPIVLIGRKKCKIDNYPHHKEYVFPSFKIKNPGQANAEIAPIEPFYDLKLYEHHYFYKQDIKAVQFAKIFLKREKNGGDYYWAASHDSDEGNLYKETFYPLVSAVEYFNKEHSSYLIQTQQDMLFIKLSFPMVIVNDGLYYVDSMADKIEPKEIPYMTFTRRLDSANNKGVYRIEYITKNGLKDFIKLNIDPFIDGILKAAKENPKYFNKRSFQQIIMSDPRP
jgi:hypothetical protein